MPTSADMLLGLDTINKQLIDQFLGRLPDDLPPDKRAGFLKQFLTEIGVTNRIVDNLTEQSTEMQDNVEDSSPQGSILASKKFFSLSKIAQIPPPAAAPAAPLMQPEPTPQNAELPALVDPSEPPPALNQAGPDGQMLQFVDAASVRDQLEATAGVDEALNTFMSLVSDEKTEFGPDSNALVNPKQVISDSVKTYFEGKGTLSQQDKLQIASTIFEALPESVKMGNDKEKNLIPAQEQTVASVVEETNNAIRKAAQTLAKERSSKPFNLKRFAQHKGFENVIYTGPGQTKVDAFTGNMISNLHLVERNKGFGLKVDDVLDIDFETIWRGTVMDKYSRPYRDKDGNWVGGYLNKRFETDVNIPEGNNYQLKPGQRRRPYLPEFRSTEARLEAMREAEGKDRGYAPDTSGSPFDWKLAQKKKPT